MTRTYAKNISSALFWSAVLIGILPFVLAALYPFLNTGLCRDVTSVSETFCHNAMLRADFALQEYLWPLYASCLVVGFAGITLKRRITFIFLLTPLLAPLTISTYLSYAELSPASLARDHSLDPKTLTNEIKAARAKNVMLRLDLDTLRSAKWKVDTEVYEIRENINKRKEEIGNSKTTIDTLEAQKAKLKPRSIEIFYAPINSTERTRDGVQNEQITLENDQAQIDDIKEKVERLNEVIGSSEQKNIELEKQITNIETDFRSKYVEPIKNQSGISINLSLIHI